MTLSGHDDIVLNTINVGNKKIYIFKNEFENGSDNNRTFINRTNDIFKAFENKEILKTFFFDFGERG